MEISFVLLVAAVLLGCAWASPLSQQELELEIEFFNSLSPEQRGLWGKIKDTVANVAIGTGVNILVSAALGKRDASNEDLELFLASLTSEQRGLWGKIKDKVTNAAVGAGVNLAIGAVLGKK